MLLILLDCRRLKFQPSNPMFLLQKVLEYGKSVNDAVVHQSLLYIAFAAHVEIRNSNFQKIRQINIPIQQFAIYQNRIHGLTGNVFICLEVKDGSEDVYGKVVKLDQNYSQVVVVKDALVFISRCRITVMVNFAIKFSRNIVSEMISGQYCYNNDICILSRNGIEYYQCLQSLKPYKSIITDYKNTESMKMYGIPNSKLMLIYDGTIRLCSPDVDVSKPFPHVISSFQLVPNHQLHIIHSIMCCTTSGDYFYIHIHDTLNDFEIQFITKNIIASTIINFGNNLFLGSKWNDSAYVSISNFDLLHQIPSLAPITKMSNSNATVSTISHAYPSLAMSIHNGIPFIEHGSVECPSYISYLHAIGNFLVIGFRDATRVFSLMLDTNELQEVEDPILNSLNGTLLHCEASEDQNLYNFVTTQGLFINNKLVIQMDHIETTLVVNTAYLLFGTINDKYVVYKDQTPVYQSDALITNACIYKDSILFVMNTCLYKTDLNFQMIQNMGILEISAISVKDDLIYIGSINGHFMVYSLLNEAIVCVYNKQIGSIPINITIIGETIFVNGSSSFIYTDEQLIELNQNVVSICQLDGYYVLVTPINIIISTLGELNKYYLKQHGKSEFNEGYGDGLRIRVHDSTIKIQDELDFILCEIGVEGVVSALFVADATIFVGINHHGKYYITRLLMNMVTNTIEEDKENKIQFDQEIIKINKLGSYLIVAQQRHFSIIKDDKIIDTMTNFIQIVAMDVNEESQTILIGDLIKSVFVFEIKNDKILAKYRDPRPKWTMATIKYKENILISDDGGNIYVMNEDLLGSIQGYKMDDTINTMSRDGDTILYGTIGGTMGVFVGLEDVEFMILYLVQMWLLTKMGLEG